MSRKSQRGWLYLIHFSQPYHHARHYLGFVAGRRAAVDARLHRHRAGTGARLCQVVADSGRQLQLAAVWPGTRGEERVLKRRSRLAAHCPLCQAERMFSGLPKRRI